MSILFPLRINIYSQCTITYKKIGGSGEMEEKKVAWLELFCDLLFVAAVAVATHVLLHVEDGHIHIEYLVKFVLIFIPIWWARERQTIFVNRFGKDLFY